MRIRHRLAAACHSNVDDAAFALCFAAFAVSFAGLFGTADPAGVAGPRAASEVAAAPGQGPRSGDLAGVHTDGTPIYRITGMTVSASRATEMARMQRENRTARVAKAVGGAS